MDRSALVLLHGFPLNRRMWDHVVPLLSQRYNVLTVDFPGFGDSATQSANSLVDWAVFVALWLDRIGVNEAVHLCGLSMGGYVALEFAARFPDRLDSLILCDTKTTTDTETARNGRIEMAGRLENVGVADRMQALKDVADAMIPKLIADSESIGKRAVVQQVEEFILAADPHSIATAQRAMAARRDTTSIVEQLQCPLLGIVGERDAITPIDVMREIVMQADRGTLAVIEGSGHLPPLENPAGFAAAILDSGMIN